MVEAGSIGGLISIFILILFKITLTTGYSALINASKSALRERADNGDRGADRAVRLGEDASSLLALHQYLSILLTILISGAIFLTLLPTIETFLVDTGIEDKTTAMLIGLAVIVPLLSAFLLIFGERVPIGTVIGRAEPIAIGMSRPMQALLQIFSPFIFFNLRISKSIARMLGGSGVTHLITEEEIKTIVDAGSEEGVIEDEEKEMIYSIIRFGDTVAREVMLPRIDIVALDINSTMEEALDLIIARGHSRIPIFRDNIDNIEGVLYAKDLLEVWRSGEEIASLEGILREPHFVPESKRASDLLIELQNRKIHMVFVVDEYGGTAGLVTLEDLVEEIVGEIQDEYDTNEEALLQQIDESMYIFSARIDLDHLNHLLDVSIPTEESDTLGGYIFSELGRVPVVGDEIHAHDLVITVQSVTGRRIRKVKVQRMPRVQPDEISEVVEEDTQSGSNENLATSET